MVFIKLNSLILIWVHFYHSTQILSTMKNMLLGAFALLLSLSPSASAQFGIEGGLTFNQLSDAKVNNVEKSFESAQGKHLGIFYGMGRNVGLRLGVRYSDAEGLYKGLSSGNTDGFKANFVEFPVDLRLRVNTPLLKPYLVAGPLFRVAAGSDDEDFKEAVKSLNVAASVGGGVELRLGGLSLYPEINYTVGVSSFLKTGATIGGVSVNAEDNSQLNQFVIKLGIGFH